MTSKKRSGTPGQGTPAAPVLAEDANGANAAQAGGKAAQGGKGKAAAQVVVTDGTPGAAAAAGPAGAVGGTPEPTGVSPMQIDSSPARAPTLPRFLGPEEVSLPLTIHTRLQCLYRDGSYHRCRVLEKRRCATFSGPETDPKAWDYFVHWHKLNRRMDSWVNGGDMDYGTVERPGADNKRKLAVPLELSSDDEDIGGYTAEQQHEHEAATKVRTCEVVQLGQWEMDTWYFSPLPEGYNEAKVLYFNEFTLDFFTRRSQLLRHLSKCRIRHPPGDEIYRKDNICMFEVDGAKDKAYCRNLCWLAKMFLDHKCLTPDTDEFYFFVMCEVDSRGAHIAGYFSKEKDSLNSNNLACILVLPPYQRKGYGKFLISFSYELSKIEKKPGGPERPISDLGRRGYEGYWTRKLLPLLLDPQYSSLSIKQLSEETMITPADIVYTLQDYLQLIQYKGGQHVLCAAPELLEKYIKEAGSPGLEVVPDRIVWQAPKVRKKDDE